MSRADRAARRIRRQDIADLVIASRNGNVKTVTTLLARGVPPNNKHSVTGECPNLSALFLAALYGHSSVVTLLLAAPSIDVNASCIYKHNAPTTALIVAAAGRHTSVVTLLLAAPGISVNASDGAGMTALCSACCLRDADDMVSQLLAHPDIDVNLGAQYPLYHATLRGIISVVSLLLADNRFLVDALNVATDAAVGYNHLPVLLLLLADQRVQLGSDILLVAAESADLVIVELLLARPDVNVNHRDTYGQTPLSSACYRGEIPITELIFCSPALNREYFFRWMLLPGPYNLKVRTAVFNGCLGRANLDLTSLAITGPMATRLGIALKECTGVTTVDLRDNLSVNSAMVSIVAQSNPRMLSIRFTDSDGLEIRNAELYKRQREFVQEAHDLARYLYQITRRTNMDLHHVAHIGAMAFPEKFVQHGPDFYERAKCLLLKLLLIVQHEPPPPHMLKRLMNRKFVQRAAIGLGLGLGYGLGYNLAFKGES